ncbi:hypothetical protein [Actinophytocola sp.]|uniref:hypothetical protein n=1 Tax=Actinophytocola sp. TaxID=1872138 RepID=UPI00389A5609
MDLTAESTRRRFWVRLATTLVLVVAAMLPSAHAVADPVDPASVPANLRQYVPDSAEWLSSPWMTAESCRDHGGDWSTYAAYLIKDFPELLQFFQPDFAGTDANAGARKDLLLRGYRDLAANLTVPSGYCVDQVKAWAKPNPQFQPFGFEWGNVDNMGDHGVRPWSGCSSTDTFDAVAPCRGFYLSCDGAITQQEDQTCQAWNAFSDDYVQRMNTVLRKAFTQYQAVGDGSGMVETCIGCKSPAELAQEFLNWVAKTGMEQVVSFIVSGVTKLWGVFLRIATDYSAPQLTGVAFASVYNLVAGVALALAFLGWLVTLAGSWRRGQLQYSLFGGIKAAAGVTLAGVGAILMLQLANDCTKALLSAGGDIMNQADFTGSLAKVNPLVAVVAGIAIGISLIFAIIFLVINPALVLMWALAGSLAAAGQVHAATSGWVWKWSGRLTALAWAPFVMVAEMLLSQGLLLPLDPGEDPVEQVIDVGQGLTLCVLLFLCPWLLWELVDFVGDRIGGAAASGGVAGRVASSGSTRGAAMAGGAVGTAVRAMVAGAQAIGRGRSGEDSSANTGAGSSGGQGRGRSSPATPPPDSQKPPSAGTGTTQPSGTESRAEDASTPMTVRGGGGGDDGIPSVPSVPPPANRGRVVASAPPRRSTNGSSGPSGSTVSSGSGERESSSPPPIYE